MEKNRLAAPGSDLVVDSGALFFDDKALQKNAKWALTKAQVISRAYKYMKATAINVGALDLQGYDFLRQEAEGGLPIISANLMDSATKAPVFTPYIIAEVAGLRIAFFGLLSPKLPPFIEQALADKVFVKDPVETAREVINSLQGRADLIVLLSDLGLDRERDLAVAISGNFFILGGHDGRLLRWPYKIGNTYIFQSYKKGMYLGELEIILSNPTEPFQNAGEVDQLKQEISNVENRIEALEGAKERNPDRQEDYDKVIASLAKNRESLQKRLLLAQQASVEGNRFFWTLEALGVDLPEDEEVLSWVRETGLTKD